MTSAAVIVPIKAFHAAKLRLAPALDPTERAALARDLAGVVVRAAAPLPAVVVCDDEDVRTWAEAAGARVLWTPGQGLNGAVMAGVDTLGGEGVDTVVVAHADLPLARSLAWTVEFPGVTVVPDRRRDGTNVLALPTGTGFTVAYGPGSFARHRAEAARCHLPLRIVADPDLGWDVDLPSDLNWGSRAAAHTLTGEAAAPW